MGTDATESRGLVVFDIDGTLLQTSAVDDLCFAQTLRELFGIEEISTDWGAYDHSTDGAIVAQLIREQLGRPATDADFRSMQERFVALLDAEAKEEPARFASTPGAAELLSALTAEGWHGAIATGGWSISARRKLGHAGLHEHGMPSAYADDHESREGIIVAAVQRAIRHHEHPRWQKVVYVGDGLWDLRASRALEIGFVGLARGDRARALREDGATHVHPDFLEVDSILRSLEDVGAPGHPSIWT